MTANELNATASIIRMVDVWKSFGPVHANRGATLGVAQGEIHALVGENGAGKSTLMRILSGMYAPDRGEVHVGGADVTGWSTREAIDAGVGMVHQHFMLVPTLTVAENVVLGRELTSGPGQLDAARAEREVAALSERTGLAVAADRHVSELTVGEAQRVEILKSLYRGARILVLDEPTAVLSPLEVRELWQVLRRMRQSGDTVVLITHKLDEVLEVSDSVTVLRHGETVARMPSAEATPAQIAKAMVGRDVMLAADLAREADGAAPPLAAKEQAPALGGRAGPALAAHAVTIPGSRGTTAVQGLSFEIARGEILGVAGVEGNGQTELVEALAGLRPVRAGTIELAGTDITRLSVKARGDAGLSHIPEDRHARGLVLDFSVADNLILGQQDQFARSIGRGRALERRRIEEHAWQQIAQFDIRPANPALAVRMLSGGNQQKIVVAREMARPFELLLAAQPTRGVDVGAVEFIHRRLRDARALGRAILLISADLGEVLALADRIAVMYRGRFVAVLPRREATEEVLGGYMTGARAA